MKAGRNLVSELKKLLDPASPEPATVPARAPRQPAHEWVARNRCW
jgi:hypothetical protein